MFSNIFLTTTLVDSSFDFQIKIDFIHFLNSNKDPVVPTVSKMQTIPLALVIRCQTTLRAPTDSKISPVIYPAFASRFVTRNHG